VDKELRTVDKCIRCNKPLTGERRVPPFGEKKVLPPLRPARNAGGPKPDRERGWKSVPGALQLVNRTDANKR
jgi:hypothetical protein